MSASDALSEARTGGLNSGNLEPNPHCILMNRGERGGRGVLGEWVRVRKGREVVHMVLAPSLPIQCKQIHEAPSVLSPVQIESTGMRRRKRRRREEGGVHRYSTASYLTSNPKSFFFFLFEELDTTWRSDLNTRYV